MHTPSAERSHTRKTLAQRFPTSNERLNWIQIFAMAYMALGGDYWSLGEVGRASEYYTKAFQLREHASERERLDITADYYSNVTGELDKAAETRQQEIASYPRDAGGYGNYGTLFASLGQYEKAIEVTRQALRLAPG